MRMAMFGSAGKEFTVGIVGEPVTDMKVGVIRYPQAPVGNMSLEYAGLQRARVIRELKGTQLSLQKTIAFWKRRKI